MSDWYDSIMGAAPFGGYRRSPPAPEQYVPRHDPNEPPNSPYYIPPPVAVVPIPATVPEPVAPEPKVSALEAAAGWLEVALVPDGMMVAEVQERAHKAGIAPRTLRRAAERLHVVRAKQGVGGWHWSLPEQAGQE
jgi:hypothetical protein